MIHRTGIPVIAGETILTRRLADWEGFAFEMGAPGKAGRLDPDIPRAAPGSPGPGVFVRRWRSAKRCFEGYGMPPRSSPGISFT